MLSKTASLQSFIILTWCSDELTYTIDAIRHAPRDYKFDEMAI